MNAEQATKTAVRLQVYVELVKQRIAGETNAEKRAFFERDLKKTMARIARLR